MALTTLVILMGVAMATASITSHVNSRVVYGAQYSSPSSSTPAYSTFPSNSPSPGSSTLEPSTLPPNTQPTNFTEPAPPSPPTTTSQPPSTSPNPTTSEEQETTASSITTSEHSSPSQDITTFFPTTPSSPETSPDPTQEVESSFRTLHPHAYSSHPRPSYPQPPTYGLGPVIPACADNTTKPWCLEDSEYPTYEIKHAVEHHYEKVLSLYADVDDLNTELSVDLPKTIKEETYVCSSETAYVRLLRAQNTDGKWRVIVNNIKAHYVTLTQTTRIEACLKSGQACPLVPQCYESQCLQKSIYHRFLVYDPNDQYFPFAIETFKLPASCACLLGALIIDH